MLPPAIQFFFPGKSGSRKARNFRFHGNDRAVYQLVDISLLPSGYGIAGSGFVNFWKFRLYDQYALQIVDRTSDEERPSTGISDGQQYSGEKKMSDIDHKMP